MLRQAPTPAVHASRAVGAEPLAPRWLPLVAAAVVAPAFLVKVKSYDVWWHLATGRWMVEHHRLPTTDPFTYTMPGKPWHLVNGLSDLVLYGFYRLGAEDGLVLFKVVFAWALFSLLGLCLRQVRCSATTLVPVVACAALLVHGRYTEERPMLLGAVLLAACQLAALRSQERRDRAHLFFLVALPLWPLVHATALLGLAQLGALLVAAVLTRAPRRHSLSVAATLGACLVAAAALPWWRDLFSVASDVGSGATASTFTAEWRSGLEALPDRYGHWALLLGGLAGGLLRVRRAPLLLLLASLGVAISARFGRNAHEGVLLAAPAFGCALEDVSAWLRGGGRRLYAAVVAPLGALAVASAQVATAPLATIGGPFGFGVVKHFPFDTLLTLRRLPVHRLFNDFPIGGFLIWENGPWGVYCDGRTFALYDEEAVQKLFVPQIESAEALTAAADAWDAPYGLNENFSPPNQWMMTSPAWIPLHLGVGTTLFLRATRAGELPPDVMPLYLLRDVAAPGWMAGWYRGILEHAERRSELTRQVTEAARLNPGSLMLEDIVHTVQLLDADYGDELALVVGRARTR